MTLGRKQKIQSKYRLKIYATIDLHAKGNIRVILNVFWSLDEIIFWRFTSFQVALFINLLVVQYKSVIGVVFHNKLNTIYLIRYATYFKECLTLHICILPPLLPHSSWMACSATVILTLDFYYNLSIMISVLCFNSINIYFI